MGDFSQETWKEIAWNGISFSIPSTWQVGMVGKRHLLLEEEFGPVMEIKWKRIRGSFSHKKHLRRLASHQGKHIRKTINPCPAPPGWETFLTNFQASTFSWHGEEISGRGVFLYCPSCRHATLIQFFGKTLRDEEDTHQRVLSSFRDHGRGKETFWSIFDIRAVIPERFGLTRYRFEAGEYELLFSCRGQKIILHRWGLASFHLRNRTLRQFAGSILNVPHNEIHSSDTAFCQTVDWISSPSRGMGGRFMARIRKKFPFQMSRIWQIEEKNTLFGVSMKGVRPFDGSAFDRVCNKYESYE